MRLGLRMGAKPREIALGRSILDVDDKGKWKDGGNNNDNELIRVVEGW
jgi:hypothetical protein